MTTDGLEFDPRPHNWVFRHLKGGTFSFQCATPGVAHEWWAEVSPSQHAIESYKVWGGPMTWAEITRSVGCKTLDRIREALRGDHLFVSLKARR